MDTPRRKKAKLESIQESVARPTPTSADASEKTGRDRTEPSSAKTSKAKTPLEKLAERAVAPKITKPTLGAILRTPQEEKEDAYIAYLERKLGWVKGGKRTARYGKGEDEDGLDGKHVNTLAFRRSIRSLASQISSMA